MTAFVSINETIGAAIKLWSSETFMMVSNQVKKNLSGAVLKVGVYPVGSGKVGGRLRSSIDLVSRTTEKGFQVGTNVNYGVAWEMGTVGGIIAPKTKKALHWVSAAGQDVFSKGHFLPKQAARPFLRPAIEQNLEPMKHLLAQRLTENLKKSFPSLKINVSLNAP